MPRTRRQAERPTTVCFVRHGTTPTTGKVLPGRARGLHLSEAGSSEAKGTADRLAGTAVAAVYSSPLERARETAAPIADAVKRPIIVDRGLVECDFGDWTGIELSKLRKLPEWNAVQQWPSGFRFPGGESFLEVQARLAGVVQAYRTRHPGEIVVAVSHADCIKVALASALGVPLDLFQRIVVGTCSTSVVSYGSGGAIVVAVNTFGSVPALAAPKRPASRRPAARIPAARRPAAREAASSS